MLLWSEGLEGLVQAARGELLLFASIGILLIGIDDLVYDLLWLASARRARRATPVADDQSTLKGRIAVFVPAWDEAAALPAMMRRALAAWDGEDFRLYVGCYPNDPATLLAISPLAASDDRIRIVIGSREGPTTKGDNLNRLWAALGEDEREESMRFAAIVLHDAEDHVHREELALYRRHLTRHAMVQIPVVALIARSSRWIGGHYGDEFAEAHGKELVLRSRLGMPIPSAGVGCALTRRALSLLAIERGGEPFRADSLTEDYEVGMLVSAYGLTGCFVDEVDARGSRIASSGGFPTRLDAAVRQKARWIAGIALAGWDHIGWPGSRRADGAPSRTRTFLARWMLWRDRRAPLAALVLLAAYLGTLFSGLAIVGRPLFGWQAPDEGTVMPHLLTMAGALLVWRLAMRFHFAARWYGWRQGLMALPRAVISNIVAILAARRALSIYWRMLRSGRVVWDKTDHSDCEGAPELSVARGARL